MTSALATLLLLTACEPEEQPPVDTDIGDTDTAAPIDEPACAEAEARLGYRVCVPTIPDDATFTGVTIASSSVDQLRVGKYLVPATDTAGLTPVFLDVNAFTLHYDFLIQAFPDLFSGLTTGQYQDLILYPDTRQYYGGTFSLYINADGFFYGFTVWDDPADSTSTITQDDVTEVWRILQPRFAPGELAWVPNSSAQQEAALSWDNAEFPIENPAEVDYEVYNPGEAYGYIRLYELGELSDAATSGEFGSQDILIIDEAPEDLERVVSAIVTGTRQGDLSHLNVRSTARGTPNCYIDAPLEALAEWEGQLVRFECGATTWSAEPATIEDAAAWWDSIRPDPVSICAPVLDDEWMPNLLELPTATPDDRDRNVCTYGAKGANLATLYTIVPEENQLLGFLIPFYYYDQFVRTHTWEVDLGTGPSLHTFQETIDAWHVDPDFLTDAAIRGERLEALTYAMEHQSEVDPEVMDALVANIREIWGDDTTMVRFRSSSNAEDGLEFSGAGLYLSESGCVADELDGDALGPSACDTDKPDEQTVSHAVLEVWSSTWGLVAWEERYWYGIEYDNVAMGILADTRTNGELANIVAFTGNPTSAGDDRYLVNAQYGELEVVAAESGVYPEKNLLTVEDGSLVEIDRVSQSSEAEIVLTDTQLEEIASLLWDIQEAYPQDDAVPEGHDVLWDMELKVLSDNQLIIKQIRPFLR
jgi:pyruvate,water dikinase